jgi:integrase
MKRIRHQNGGVFLDRRYGLWYYRKTINGKRQLTPIGTIKEFPTKAAAELAAAKLIAAGITEKKAGVTFEAVALQYMAERMPKRFTTANGYRNCIENYCIPKFGSSELAEIEPMEIWRWLNSLTHPKTGEPLAGGTRGNIRDAMRQVYEYAMLAGMIDIVRNPIELVKVTGSSKRTRKPRVLSYEEWERFIGNVSAEPQRTAIITCLCLGVRREEVWALKWSDFDFITNTVMIQRAIVESKVMPSVKTEASEAPLPLDEAVVAMLLAWRSQSEFNADSDWVWASPYKAGEMPYHFQSMQKEHIVSASVAAGLGKIGWHCLRHTYRAWLNAAGTPLGVQKDLMRHSSITMTTQYGAGVIPAMREANSLVVRKVIRVQ